MIKKLAATIKLNNQISNSLIMLHIQLYGRYNGDDEVVEKISKENERLKNINNEIENIISNIQDPLKKEIATEKFINGKNWKDISLKLCYAESTLFGIYSTMLKDPQILKVKKLIETI